MPRIDPRVHLPEIVTRWFAKATWRVGGDGKAAYLTFDDGPVPEMTPWVLDVLQKEGIKATFFCAIFCSQISFFKVICKLWVERLCFGLNFNA